MHFCQDELFAIMNALPFIAAAWYALRSMTRKLFKLPDPPIPPTSEPHQHSEKCVGHGPYRTATVKTPKKNLRERFAEVVADLRARFSRKVAEMIQPICATKGCEFRKRAMALNPDRSDHSILWTDREYLSGSKNSAFSYSMSIPHKFRCRYCKRPFRIGDPIPEGATLDHWSWMKSHRRRPEYLTEIEWQALEASDYFENIW